MMSDYARGFAAGWAFAFEEAVRIMRAVMAGETEDYIDQGMPFIKFGRGG